MPAIAPRSSGQALTKELFTIDSTALSNKYVTLATTPSTASSILVAFANGIQQTYGVDYSVTLATNRVGWNTLGMDGLVEAGDVLEITYQPQG